ncbi:MAG: YihA family ribosome biogenesis GTP-binding protein [Gemmatimonadales bacterium]|nr:MAG: YihA family ribosome biogenesis GTP-binding protein [Gemmatimonadales bacterium]
MKIRSVDYAGTIVEPDAPLPGDLPQVAFAGRSNVGKSSLINALLRRTRKKIAHVSATPGKTRAVNFFRVNDRFFLVDLPGYGYARVPDAVRDSWARLMEGYLSRPDGPVAVVHLVDARHPPTGADVQMLGYLAQVGLPALVVLTKIDKLSHSERTTRLREAPDRLGLDPEQIIPFSSKTGEGRDALLGALDDLLAATEAEGAQVDRGETEREEAQVDRGEAAATEAEGAG